MTHSPLPPLTGVIVVAERPLHDLLAGSEVSWWVQDRQPTIAAMWDALSGGRLDQHSRILVFSDSTMAGTGTDEAELTQTARAIVAMAHAGARVFVAVWRPAELPHLQDLIVQAAAGQGVSPGALVYHLLPVEQGGRAVLESMRRVLAEEVAFPAQYPLLVDAPLARDAFAPSPIWTETVTLPTAAAPEAAPPAPPAPAPPTPAVPAPAPPEPAPVAPTPPAPVAPEPAPSVPPVAMAPSEPAPVPPGPAPAAPAPAAPAAPVPVEAQIEPPAPAPIPRIEQAPIEQVPIVPAPPAPTPPAPIPPPVADQRPRSAPGLAPGLPPLGSGEAPSPAAAGYPPSASMELLGRPKPAGQITITVTSSKGGSGKSTASILLGGSIARASANAGQPLSVCLIDLDTRDGQVASLIGKFMPTALNIRVQPVWDEERIRRNLVRADGLDIDCLLAPIRPRTADTVGPDFFRTIVRSLQRMFDVVIMDTSVQYLEPLIADVAMREADEILFVTTLASTAVQGMARALREITAPLDESGLGIPREKIGIIVNQSVANVGMERDQVLAAGLGVPVVGVIPLATKDVLTATNLNRMYALLDHPLIGPAYNELARACLPGRNLAPFHGLDAPAQAAAPAAAGQAVADDESRRRGLFRR